MKSNRQAHGIPRSLIGLHSNCEVLCNTWNLSNLSNRLSNDFTNGQGIRLFGVLSELEFALGWQTVRFLPEGFVGSEPRSETNLTAQDFVGMIRDHAAQ